MSRTLHTPVWRRIRDIQVTLGPVGAGLTLDLDSRAEDVIGLVPEVERAIQNKFGVTYFTDPELQVGQWFMITETPTLQVVSREPELGVLFIGDEGSRFVLGGSTEYLLDRRVPVDVRTVPLLASASSLNGIHDILEVLVEYDYASNAHQDHDIETEATYGLYRRVNFSSIFSRLLYRDDPRVRSYGGTPEPMSALARCLEIDNNPDDNKRTVIGTPLYVAFDAPM
jgi:hypothetical protein